MSRYTLKSLIEAKDSPLTGDESPEELSGLTRSGRMNFIKSVLRKVYTHPHNAKIVKDWNLDAGQQRFFGPKSPGYLKIARSLSNIVSRMPSLQPQSYSKDGFAHYWTSNRTSEEFDPLIDFITKKIESLGYEMTVQNIRKMPAGSTLIQQQAFARRMAGVKPQYHFKAEVGTLLLPVLTLSRGNDETPNITAPDCNAAPSLIRVLSTTVFNDPMSYTGVVSALRDAGKDTPRVDELEEYSVGISFMITFSEQTDGTPTVTLTTNDSLIALSSLMRRVPFELFNKHDTAHS